MKFALNNSYPIDNAGQVKVAGLYFDKYLTKFSPADRVIIANNLEKQAEVLGVYLDYPWILNYGRMTKNASYSPDFEINMKMRKELCKSGHVMVKIGESVVDGASVVDKLLAAKESTSPQAMTGALDAFDKAANFATHYDQRVMDPVFTVYGSLNSPDYDSIPVGYDLTNRHLKKVACNENVIDKLASVMNESVVEDFRLHPFEAFVAMRPQEQRLVADLIKQACDGKMPEAASLLARETRLQTLKMRSKR